MPARDIVLHVITDLGRGGAETMLTRLVLAHQRQNTVRNVVVSLLNGGDLATKLRKSNIEVHGLGLDRWTRLPGAFFRLVAIMYRLRPRLVMTWLYHADLVGTLAAVASGLGVNRVIWNVRCSNIDFAKYAYTTGLIVKILTWLSPLPRMVCVNSSAGRRAHVKLGYRARKWTILPNGLDLEEFRPDHRDRIQVREELRVHASTFLVGMIARADPQKDFSTLLAAAKMVTSKCPTVSFVIAGRNTEKLPRVDRVTALGEHHDVARLLRGLDLVVLSSAYGEGSSNIIAEAMATGIVCIATDVGDAAALLQGSGTIVQPNNAKELATAIEAVANEDLETRAQRGQHAREAISRAHNILKAAEVYQALYDSVAALGARPDGRTA